MTIDEIIAAYRRSLINREAAQAADMGRRWVSIVDGLEDELNRAIRDVRAFVDAGMDIGPAALQRVRRYEALYAQAQAQAEMYAQWVGDSVYREAVDYMDIGITNSIDALKASYYQASVPPPTAVINAAGSMDVAAVQNLAAVIQDGAPIKQILQEAFPKMWEQAQQTLLSGLAAGKSPRDIAKAFTRGLDGMYDRALRIARTEQLRAYREASRATYQESGVVHKYKRMATKDTRTCMACIALDGTIYPSNTPLADHPNGRCSMIPIVDGLPPVSWQKGPDWFDALDPNDQLAMMGRARFDAYQEKRLRVSELAKLTTHPIFGDGIALKNLDELNLT